MDHLLFELILAKNATPDLEITRRTTNTRSRLSLKKEKATLRHDSAVTHMQP